MSRDSATFSPIAKFGWQMSAVALAGGVFLAAYLSWRPGSILFTVSDMLFVLGIGGLLIADRLPLRPFGSATPYWLLAVTVMLGGLLLGSLVNGNPYRWLTDAVQYVFSFVVLPIILMQQGPKRTRLFMAAQIAGIVCMEAFGLIVDAYYGGDYRSLQKFGREFVTGEGRLSAFPGDANWNSEVIAMTTPFVYYFRINRWIGRLTFYTVLGVLLTAMLFAASVTGTVSAIAAAGLFVLIGRIRISPLLIVVAIGALMIYLASGSGLPRAFQTRIASAVESGNLESAGTFQGRLALMREAWDIVGNTMIVGLGSDQFRVVSAEKAPVHDMYLLLWAEGGLPAMVAWVGMMVMLVAGGIGAISRDRLSGALALSVFSGFFIFSLASPHMYARICAVPLFLAMAQAFWVNRQSTRSSRVAIQPNLQSVRAHDIR